MESWNITWWGLQLPSGKWLNYTCRYKHSCGCQRGKQMWGDRLQYTLCQAAVVTPSVIHAFWWWIPASLPTAQHEATLFAYGAENTSRLKLLRISITFSLCKVNVRHFFTATVNHNNQFVVGSDCSIQVCLRCTKAAQKTHFGSNFFTKCKKDNMRAFKKCCQMMLFCLSAMCICTHIVYWKRHPLWLLSHWEPTCHMADMTLFEWKCVHMIRAAVNTPTWQSDWSVKAAHKQACPFPDRKLGAAETLPCLICQQRSLPPCLITENVSDGVHKSKLNGWFDFTLCDTSVACHVVLCLSVSRAQLGQTCLSCFLSCLQTGPLLTNWPAWSETSGRSGGLKRRDVHLCGWCYEPSLLIACCQSASCTTSGLCIKEMHYLLALTHF